MRYSIDLGRDGAPTGVITRESEDGALHFFDPQRDGPFAREYRAWLGAGNEPATPQPVSSDPQPLDFLSFMALFTPAEQAALVNSDDTQIRLFLLQASGAGEIELSDPRVTNALGYLTESGVLAPGRAATILGAAAP